LFLFTNTLFQASEAQNDSGRCDYDYDYDYDHDHDHDHDTLSYRMVTSSSSICIAVLRAVSSVCFQDFSNEGDLYE